LLSQPVEFIEIDPQLLTVEVVGVAVANEYVAEKLPRFARCLIEAGGSASWVFAWPQCLEQFVAACRTPLHCKVGDQLSGRLSSRLLLLAAGELKRSKEENPEPLVASVSRSNVDRRGELAWTVLLKLRCCQLSFSAFTSCWQSEDR
jgi:hypothetical protein